MSYTVVIPARYGSTRLPGKPLKIIAGKPMVQLVYECAIKSSANRVVIATDDARIVEACRRFDAEVILTRHDHNSGTDRLAEVSQLLDSNNDEIYVNVQGDEPMMPSSMIDQVAKNLIAHPEAALSTLYEPINDANDIFDENCVKVLFDHRGFALYFSRAPIPYWRNQFHQSGQFHQTKLTAEKIANGPYHAFRHIGLYAYRVGFLREFIRLAPAEIEVLESLEQLRALYYGHSIHVAAAVDHSPISVDTQADLDRAEALLLNTNDGCE